MQFFVFVVRGGKRNIVPLKNCTFSFLNRGQNCYHITIQVLFLFNLLLLLLRNPPVFVVDMNFKKKKKFLIRHHHYHLDYHLPSLMML